MRNLPAGSAFTVTIPFKDGDGNPVQPTGAMWCLLDEDEALIHGPVLVTPTTSEIVVSVSAELARLDVGANRGIRTIEVEADTPAGALHFTESVMLRVALLLRPPVNSFQTFAGAQLTAADMVKIDGFNNAAPDAQTSALLEAYQRLIRLGFFARPGSEHSSQSYITDGGGGERISPRRWGCMSEGDYEELPLRFRQALRRAQVEEANAILLVGSAEEYRRMGLSSKSTGESSATFRAGKPLDLGVSRLTLSHLTGFIEGGLAVSRG